MEKEQLGDKIQNCGEIQGDFTICFSKHNDDKEKFSCIENVREIIVNGKARY